MSAKHTPGPWFPHEPINAKRRDFGVVAVRPYDPSRGAVRRIAWVGNAKNHNTGLQDELRANAYLIAAAPDLLAALKDVVRIADRNTVEFEAARAAISKAESTS